MKRHLTVLTAIAVATIGILVVVINLGPAADEANSAKALQQLQRRQSERFKETREARLAEQQMNERERKLKQLKAQLLEEFPNLRADPAIPNEENSIYLFDELANELLREGSTFRAELEALMGKNAEWNLEATQAFLKRYDWVFDKLDQVVTTPSGDSYHYERDVNRQWHPDAPLLIMDLVRLKIRVLHASEDRHLAAAHEAFSARLAERITKAESSPYMNQLMIEAALDTPIDAPMDEKLYRQFSIGLYGGSIMGWLDPHWGETLDPESLSREIRRIWWADGQITHGHPFLAVFIMDDLLEHPEAARAYAKHVSDTLKKLEQQDIPTFIQSGPAPSQPDEPMDTASPVAWRATDTFHRQLQSIFQTARYQSLQTVAKQLKKTEKEDGPEFLARRLAKNGLRYYPADPLTQSSYSYDPETRILTLETQLKGYEFDPVRITSPDTEGALDFELIPQQEEE